MISKMRRRHGCVVFADTDYDQGMSFPMRLAAHGDRGHERTIGGIMCVDLFAIIVGGHTVYAEPIRVQGLRPLLCIDSGTEGFWSQDDTGGRLPRRSGQPPTPPVQSMSDLVNEARPTATNPWRGAEDGPCGIVIGEDPSHTFTILVSSNREGGHMPQTNAAAAPHRQGRAHDDDQDLASLQFGCLGGGDEGLLRARKG
jgi:hypothetical protein